LQPLLRLTLSENSDVQLNAIRCIVRLAATDENKVHVIKADALKTFIILIKSADPRIHIEAVAAIVCLALHTDEEWKERIVDAGVLPPLLSLLNSDNIETQQRACVALKTLAVNDHNKARMVTLGILDPLRHLLDSPEKKVKVEVMETLLSLASIKENKEQMETSGLLEALRQHSLSQNS